MRSDLGRAGRRTGAGAVIVLLLAATVARANPPLRRALGSYFVFAQESVHLKNLNLVDACNIGVNCAQPNTSSQCGIASFEDPTLGDGSQVAGDQSSFTQAGGSIYQLFRNGGGPLGNVQVRLPGSQPDGSDPLSLPILDDLDGDSVPSCGPNCTLDPGDLEKGCGFPVPFPACNTGLPITVSANSDCPSGDTQPGNSRCDLPPGVYGDVHVLINATMSFNGGSYVFCSFQTGKNATITAAGAATIDIPSPGTVVISDQSTFGQQCGDFTVRVKGSGLVNFGKGARIVGTFCAPETDIALGHGNQLTGQFIADTVHGDVNNQGRCCSSGAGLSACFNSFSPTSAHVGDTVTIAGTCDLTPVTGVTICGLPATITSHTSGEVKVTVPVGASGACAVAAQSSVGEFTSLGTLTVS